MISLLSVFLSHYILSGGFPCSSVGKRSAYGAGVCLQCRRPGFNSWVRKIPGEGNGNPLQYSCLENPIDRGAWRAIVYGVTSVGHGLAAKKPHIKSMFLVDSIKLGLVFFNPV